MTQEPARSGQLSVFISYSREDLEFADQLDATLRIGGFNSVLDRHGIAGGEDWQSKLGTLIRDADTIVFVLSPASAQSDICRWEVDEAEGLNKRIIPVVPGPLGGLSAPRGLAALNYIYFYSEPKKPGTGFGAGLLELVAALNTDFEWLREHTRLQQRAMEWDGTGRPDSRLLFGESVDEAKAWATRRPKDAPEPTALHLELIRASEEAQARRLNLERQQLEAIAAAQAERGKALAEKEAAQHRESAQARRVVQRTRIGLGVALGLAALAGMAGWQAHLRSQELERQKLVLSAANQRLSAQMKLRIAPFGKQPYAISEQWYKLATTNASSIAFIEANDGTDWQFAGTGFVIKGEALHEAWRGQILLATAAHVADGTRASRVYFPAIDSGRKFLTTDVQWISNQQHSPNVDIAIFRMSGPLPLGVWPVATISQLDLTSWAVAPMSKGFVTRSAIADPVPLLVLGAELDEPYAELVKRGKALHPPALALSLANALGRYSGEGNSIVFTDSTTVGASGSPVFDAADGSLVAIVQLGSDQSKVVDDGLGYSGGIAVSQLKRAIIYDSIQVVLAQGWYLLTNGKDDEATTLFAHALGVRGLSKDGLAKDAISAVWAQSFLSRGSILLKSGKPDEAQAQFDKAVTYDIRSAPRVKKAWFEPLLEKGNQILKEGDLKGAKAHFELALAKDGSGAPRIASAYVAHGVTLLKVGDLMAADESFRLARDADAISVSDIVSAYSDQATTLVRRYEDAKVGDLLEAALRYEPSARKRLDNAWADAVVERGSRRLSGGKVEQAKKQFDLALAKSPEKLRSIGLKYHDRGDDLLGMRAYKEARELFQRAMSYPILKTEVADRYFWRGKSLLQNDKHVEARVLFALARRWDESFKMRKRINHAWSETFVAYGLEALKKRDNDQARQWFDEALRAEPGTAGLLVSKWFDALVSRGSEMFDDGNDAGARAQFDAALRYATKTEAYPAKFDATQAIRSAWSRAFRARGMKLLRERKQARAKTQFALAVAQDRAIRRSIASDYISAGVELLTRDENDQAKEIFRQAERIFPPARVDVSGAWSRHLQRRGSDALDKGDYKEAEREFDSALARDPAARSYIAGTWSGRTGQGRTFLWDVVAGVSSSAPGMR